MVRGSIPRRAGDSLYATVKTGFGAHRASCLYSGALFPADKASGLWNWPLTFVWFGGHLLLRVMVFNWLSSGTTLLLPGCRNVFYNKNPASYNYKMFYFSKININVSDNLSLDAVLFLWGVHGVNSEEHSWLQDTRQQEWHLMISVVYFRIM
jgi:hypothetical protein